MKFLAALKNLFRKKGGIVKPETRLEPLEIVISAKSRQIQITAMDNASPKLRRISAKLSAMHKKSGYISLNELKK